jgi:hypothetical protein
MLAKIIDVRSDENYLIQLSRRGECLDRVVQSALAEIAAIAGVRPIPCELYFVGFDFLDPRTDLAGDPMRVRALGRRE